MIKKAPLVGKCFELYATGDNTLKNIKQFLADMGLDSYKGNVLSTSCVQRQEKEKKQTCNEEYLREEAFVEQMKSVIQKVSIPDDWAENMLAELDREKVNIQTRPLLLFKILRPEKWKLSRK